LYSYLSTYSTERTAVD